ncbi:MAG: hypothetical protein PHF88_02495 [Candidatus Pacebacteria bacterium]|nr:hypothetical protein [Candidatus Paceibacterota bacterium]
MNKDLGKKESILVLVVISIFSLIIVLFSIRGVNIVRDLNLQSSMEKINISLIEYYLTYGVFPVSEECNLNLSCLEGIDIFIYQDIYYQSNGKDYIIYSRSFQNKNIYFILGSDLIFKKALAVPEL